MSAWTESPKSPITEIVSGVYVGNRHNARNLWGMPGWTIIDVREDDTKSDPVEVLCIPLLRKESGYKAGQQALLEITTAIDAARAKGNRVLVHCWMGLERSPLAVACWLATSQGWTFDEAYDLVRYKRGAYDRREWLTNKVQRALKVTLKPVDPVQAFLARAGFTPA